MTNKKYQVFVSSTYEDLRDERQAVTESLLGLGCIPTGAGLQSSAENDQWDTIKQLIDECDYYIVLVGGCCGPLSPTGISYIHREYVYASTKRKPVLALVHSYPEMLPEGQREITPEGLARLAGFKHLLKKENDRSWESVHDLKTCIKQVFPLMIKQFPAIGWMRANATTNLADQAELAQLKRRVAELEHEKEQWVSAGTGGKAGLARGSDTIPVKYSCDVYIKGNCQRVELKSQLSWEEIFSAVAPSMLGVVPESEMQKALAQFIEEQRKADIEAVFPKAHAVRDVIVNMSTFNTIKVQLRALGLTKKASKAGVNNSPLWQLTPQGDIRMTQLLTVKV